MSSSDACVGLSVWRSGRCSAGRGLPPIRLLGGKLHERNVPRPATGYGRRLSLLKWVALLGLCGPQLSPEVPCCPTSQGG